MVCAVPSVSMNHTLESDIVSSITTTTIIDVAHEEIISSNHMSAAKQNRDHALLYECKVWQTQHRRRHAPQEERNGHNNEKTDNTAYVH